MASVNLADRRLVIARAMRTTTNAHNNRTAEYLLGTPLLGEYLEEGLSKLDLSCSDQDYR